MAVRCLHRAFGRGRTAVEALVLSCFRHPVLKQRGAVKPTLKYMASVRSTAAAGVVSAERSKQRSPEDKIAATDSHENARSIHSQTWLATRRAHVVLSCVVLTSRHEEDEAPLRAHVWC